MQIPEGIKQVIMGLRMLVVLLAACALSMTLQGCGGCDTDEATKCYAGSAGTACEICTKQNDCYKDCCDTYKSYTATATTAAKTASCETEVTDPCA